MPINRRSMMTASAALSAMGSQQALAAQPHNKTLLQKLVPNAAFDQTVQLQAVIDAAAETNIPVRLPAGTFRFTDLRLRSGTRLLGDHGATTLIFMGGSACVTADLADDLVLRDLVIDGTFLPFETERGNGLLSISRSQRITIENVEIRSSVHSGLSLVGVSGRIESCIIRDVHDVGLMSLDATGLDIRNNTVSGCGNNGVTALRTAVAEDGTQITGNRISNIRNTFGGTGQFGNGVNVYRASGVIVSGNRITDCTYSAIRGNASSNILITGNSCERLGEVALYAEFGFEGAVISNNIVDVAATGIAVVNFNEGGRLAVVQGNLIRNLFRREHEPVDTRGIGISVEADTVVSGNTIENAPTFGVTIGWGRYMRNVSATGNVIRNTKVGIGISQNVEAGACLIAQNLISDAIDGAIRAMDHGHVLGPDLTLEPEMLDKVKVVGNVTV
ncbi:MAG: TIGR03808 family TAT-translocated repetitive protein [Hyphomicrobium sp.]|nr:MAG: TIGR03808 family TAT-translocated repetitive protein [Hyphomicrobium sp.]PPC99012.1 MAG: TIGR03808 family TAT-translocated repetitive protein [Hyphomicrobium sp.]